MWATILNRMKNNLLFLLLIATITACTTTQPLTSSVKPKEVMEMAYFKPYSYISLIEKGNKAKYNDSLSSFCNELQLKVINKLSERIHLSEEINPIDTTTQHKLAREILYLCLIADRQRNIKNLKITPVIDSLLELNNKRFGLLTINTGFTRGSRNYGNQIAKGVGIAILTLGMYYQAPIKSNSTIYSMIVDSKENNIAFFRKNTINDKEPIDENVINSQMQKIFEGYFWTEK